MDFPEGWDLLKKADPSIERCRERYLDPERGTAAWVALPRGTLDRFLDEIHESSVVVTLPW